jgi:FixJ family two-component response regulator
MSEPVICLIDDDVAVLKGLSRLITTWGYRVRAFASAQQFLEQPASADEEIGCLVIDAHMPVMSGFELQLELDQAQRRLPIIFITGAGDEKLRNRAIADGAVDFLEKPFADVELREAVQTALTRRRTS